MPITETRTPYEFLARWDHTTGAFKGAHIQYFDAVLRDGVQIAGAPSKAFGVGDGLAFPLSDIMGQLTADALARVDALTAERDAAVKAGETATADRDAAQAQVAELLAQAASLQPPVDVNGVPQQVTMRQARLALLGAGLLSGIDATINSLPEPMKSAAKIEWEYSQAVQRHNGFVSQIAPAIGLTEEQIDALFIAAAQL